MAVPAADGGCCGSRWRQQPATTVVARAATAVVAGGGSNWKLKGQGREEDEVNLKKPSPPPPPPLHFISCWAAEQSPGSFCYNSEICFSLVHLQIEFLALIYK